MAGGACITRDTGLLADLAVNGKPPRARDRSRGRGGLHPLRQGLHPLRAVAAGDLARKGAVGVADAPRPHRYPGSHPRRGRGPARRELREDAVLIAVLRFSADRRLVRTSRPPRRERSVGVRLPPFQALLDEHRSDIYRYLVATVGAVDADDCFQETWISALRAYPGLERADNLRAWLYRIAQNKTIDAHRARARRPRPGGGGCPTRARRRRRWTAGRSCGHAFASCRRSNGARCSAERCSGCPTTSWPLYWTARGRRRGGTCMRGSRG